MITLSSSLFDPMSDVMVVAVFDKYLRGRTAAAASLPTC
jgi:hypothetical protein